MRILVFQHHPVEHPGRLGATLRDHAFRLDIRRPDLDGAGAIPADLDDVHALVIMGGPQNVTDPPGWMQREFDLVRHAHEADMPVIGICLGAQIIAHALGGTVAPMAKPEWSFADVSLTSDAQTETMLAGIPWRHPQFHCHAQEITKLPAGAVHLASSGHCRHQAFKAGLRTYGFQYHFECDERMISDFCRAFPESVEAAGTSAGAIEQQADGAFAEYARIGARLSLNLASYAFPFDELLAV